METNENQIFNKAGGAAGAVIGLLIIAAFVYILFNFSKLVYSYSRSALLSVWTFLALVGLILLSFSLFEDAEWQRTIGQFERAAWVLAGFWVAGVGSIFFSTYTLYKKKKIEVDKLIKEETYVERQISKNSGNTVKLLTGAGALYVGYTLGKKTGL